MNSPQIPLRDFFRNPEQTAYSLSPNGECLAWLAPYKNRLNIFVKKIGSDQEIRISTVEDRDLAGFFWATDNRILYLKDFGGNENFHVFGVDIDGQNETDLTPFKNVKAELMDDLRDDQDHVLIQLNKRNDKIFDPYRLNVHTGKLTILAENPGNITAWLADHQGKIRLAIATDGVNTSLLYRETEKDDFKPVLATNFRDQVSPLFFTFDNKHLYALSNLNRDKLALVLFDIANGKELEVLFEHPDVDLNSLGYSRKRKVLTAITYTTWKRQYKFLDKEREQIQQRLEQDLPDNEVLITSRNKNEDKYLIRTYNDRSLGAYYFFDKEQDTLTKIKDVSPWLKEEQLTKMRPISFQSDDDLIINGYLTLPANQEPKNLPIIINPHGGPWARDVWTFNPETQFFANRGYGVLQLNFRGSTGYGRKFWEASFKQWGLKMQDDLTQGTQWLIEQGIADPKRIAIYGSSYGGYATLAGVAFTPDLYACAVDYVGISSLFTMLETIPTYWAPYLEMLKEMIGDPENEADHQRLRATSPVFHAEKIKVPLMIVQGAQDPRVKQAEADQMVKALKEKGVEVEYILKENEGHGFRNEENRFELYEAMEVFLKKHL